MPSLVKDLADALSLSADEANGRKSQVRPSRDDLREFAEAVLGEPDDKSPVGSKQDLATVRGMRSAKREVLRLHRVRRDFGRRHRLVGELRRRDAARRPAVAPAALRRQRRGATEDQQEDVRTHRASAAEVRATDANLP